MLNLIKLLFFISFLPGCIALPIPHDINLSPLLKGTIIDGKNNQPISGVEIQVESQWGDQLKTQSDQNGRFEIVIKERKSWYIIFGVPMEGTCRGLFTISHPNYQTITIKKQRMNGGGTKGMCHRVEFEQEIRLTPKN